MCMAIDKKRNLPTYTAVFMINYQVLKTNIKIIGFNSIKVVSTYNNM